ncbi:MAG: NAD-dependent epimerase/dehydratase family protein [Bacteroidota bacterium]|nr:NAD-dependent epimerase/dehydratase family protein [Bacteroidota bacterium]
MVLVTGASGFLGSYVVCALLDRGESVVAMRRSGSDMSEFNDIYQNFSFSKNKNQHAFSWIEGDILDINFLDQAFLGMDYVFHCAAKVSFNRSDLKSLFKINVEGTANVVNACLKAKVKKLVHVSSTAAIGRSNEEKLIDEETPWTDDENNTVYAQSKHDGELEVWRGIQEGLNAVIVNPSIILGYGDWNSGSANLFKKIFNGFKFYTQGENAFVGVNDVAQIMVKLGYSDIQNERFLLISENRTYKSIFDDMAFFMNKKAPKIEIKPSHLFIFKLILPFYRIFYRNSNLTIESLKTSMKKNLYSHQKIKKAIGFEFQPIRSVIEKATEKYL